MENFNNHLTIPESDIYIKKIISVTHDIRTNPWKHVHIPKPCYEIYCSLRGSIWNSEISRLHLANTLSFLIPNSPYKTNSVELPTESIGVFFEADIPKDIQNNIFKQNFQLYNCDSNIRNSFKNMSRLYHSKPVSFEMKIRQELYNVFGTICDNIYAKSLRNSNYYTIRAADEYIKENYLRKDITVDRLAEMCKITPAYFCRVFKDVFGISPKKYIINLKMDMAKEYLTLTSTSISELSDLLGYNEISYFTTAFKNHFGITPSEFRKR